MTLLLLIPAIVIVALVLAVLGRRWYITKVTDSFATGVAVGKSIALAGDEWLREQVGLVVEA